MPSGPADEPRGMECMAASTSDSEKSREALVGCSLGRGGMSSSGRAGGCLASSSSITTGSGWATVSGVVRSRSALLMSPSAHLDLMSLARASLCSSWLFRTARRPGRLSTRGSPKLTKAKERSLHQAVGVFWSMAQLSRVARSEAALCRNRRGMRFGTRVRRLRSASASARLSGVGSWFAGGSSSGPATWAGWVHPVQCQMRSVPAMRRVRCTHEGCAWR